MAGRLIALGAYKRSHARLTSSQPRRSSLSESRAKQRAAPTRHRAPNCGRSDLALPPLRLALTKCEAAGRRARRALMANATLQPDSRPAPYMRVLICQHLEAVLLCRANIAGVIPGEYTSEDGPYSNQNNQTFILCHVFKCAICRLCNPPFGVKESCRRWWLSIRMARRKIAIRRSARASFWSNHRNE